MNDIGYMNKAYYLALKAKGKTSPNPLVGSVIVKGNKIIAEGWHRRCGADHAEVVALKKAGRRALGASMYVTLEPCFHYGRTPPCVDQIIESGIKEIIIGMNDPNPLTNGKSIAKLRRAGVKIKTGVLQKELEVMNEAFIKYTTKKIPFIAVKSAQSLDGKIATAKGHSKWITSEATRKYARRIRAEFDAILVGINTVVKDDPRLRGSKSAKCLKKIILDSSLKISPNACLFSGTKPFDVIIATTAKASAKKRAEFLKKGIHVIVCPTLGKYKTRRVRKITENLRSRRFSRQREGEVDLKWLFKELAKQEIMSILVEGGAHVIGSVLKEGLADKMYCYIAPIIIGDQKALTSIVGVDIGKISQAIQLKDITLKKIGKDILIEGYINN